MFLTGEAVGQPQTHNDRRTYSGSGDSALQGYDAIREADILLQLIGVYQEVMGSSHNMLGAPHVAEIRLAADNSGPNGATSLSTLELGRLLFTCAFLVPILRPSNDCAKMSVAACNGAVNGGSAGANEAAAAARQLHGSNFVVDHFVPGESVQCVLSRAQHEASYHLKSSHVGPACLAYYMASTTMQQGMLQKVWAAFTNATYMF